MSIINAVIKAQVSALIKNTSTNSDTSKAEEDFAKGLANIIEAAIKSATVIVTVAPGIPVATAGSPTAQVGATTGPGTGTGILT